MKTEIKKGDCVVSREDWRRDILCAGLVLETKIAENNRQSCFVVWSSLNNPKGWWYSDSLEVIFESR